MYSKNEKWDIYAKIAEAVECYFEVKGCPPSEKTRQQQMVQYFHGALGKIVSIIDMKSPKLYGIVFPDIKCYENKIMKIKNETRDLVGIHFYLVDFSGRVRMLEPKGIQFVECK